MALIMLAYWLLAIRITVRAGAALCGLQGSYEVEAGAFGVYVRVDGTVDLKRRMLRTNGGREISIDARPKRKPEIFELVSAGRFEAACIHVRLGLFDAAETAVFSVRVYGREHRSKFP